MTDKLSNLKNNNTFKLIMLIILILIMLIPISMVEDLIYERTTMRSEAETKISQSWGGSQVLTGPVLKIPYKKKISEKKNINGEEHKIHRYETHHIFMLSDELDIKTKMESEIRYLGIYDVPVYMSHSDIKASFNYKTFKELSLKYSNINWHESKIIIPFSVVRGIRSINANINLNQKKQTLNFSPYHDNSFLNGIYANVSLNDWFDTPDNSPLELSMSLSLAGSQSIMFKPFGRKTHVAMNSDWNSPGFFGDFLPSKRTINEDGFNSSWQILELNRNFPQQWIDHQVNETAINQTTFGVKLFQPVNLYQQNQRSIKYAILFVGLTYMTFFLLEVLNNKKLHPVQYFFTGGALSTFYLLLIAFSEHIGFSWAYLIAMFSISSLITVYSTAILHNHFQGVTAGIACFILYGFFYLLIQSEENALLLGAIVFFLILATLMYSTRNINWYKTEDSFTSVRVNNSL